MKTKLSLLSLILLMAGCATNPTSMTVMEKVTLEPYFEQISAACLAHHKFKGTIDESIEARCDSHAKFAIDNMEKLYLQYNEESLMDKCDISDDKASKRCLYRYQNKYYEKTTASFIEKIYPAK